MADGGIAADRTSASRRVHAALRRRIVDMTLLPGTRIVERDIAAEHGTSRTPVHEAVQRLAEEGLVEIVQRVGTFVARISIPELEQAMLIRTALEAALVERAAGRTTPAGIERLQAILARQTALAEAGDPTGFYGADEAFHAAIADMAGLPAVWRTIEQAKTQVDRFRRLTLPVPGRMDMVIAEHAVVVAALSRGDGAAAVAAMRLHLDHVLPPPGAASGLCPDYFTTSTPA